MALQRRDFLKYTGLAALYSSGPGRLAAQMPMPPAAPAQTENLPKADFTVQIAPLALELDPNLIISTTAYNGSSPGPVLRMKEGRPVTVDVVNDTDVPEYVHWHGLLIPADVDGAEEEETPVVPPRGRRRYQFTPRPAGTRWYHTHAMAGIDLHRGTYTGQFGFVIVEPAAGNPGNYDQEVFLSLRDWEPFFTANGENEATEEDSGPGVRRPEPERPPVLDTRPNGLEVASQLYSINDKALGAGDPIRVRPGSRVLFHILNASAIENRRISLPGHMFNVIALDGNAVPTPRSVETLAIGPGERIDAIVEMNQPGIWILGETQDMVRNAGLGVVVEYAGQPTRQPRYQPPMSKTWDYTVFGRAGAPQGPPPQQTIDMVFEKVPRGNGQFNSFLVNGKPYPHDREFVLKEGMRYRLVFHNRTDDAHPLHLHRHLFELVDMNGTPTSGILKDTVVVPYYGRATVDLTADQPGLTLFHCHIQQHMDFGFKALFRYA
jgi:FtsP/CotA-like multicopper oxidase with cupredoxin domain